MHLLIKQSSTGCSEEFATKMGLSRRQLLEDISELKSIGAPIKFSPIRNTYHYESDWNPFTSKLNNSQLNKITGGLNFPECSIAALTSYSIVYPSIPL
jgi:hypothetical protein